MGIKMMLSSNRKPPFREEEWYMRIDSQVKYSLLAGQVFDLNTILLCSLQRCEGKDFDFLKSQLQLFGKMCRVRDHNNIYCQYSV